ncbi:hypothetical protein KAU11_10670 [Candidatus Babeliales bacterium]|nr:hypothetical protein [Candidatus Babeliales bacterium]
MSILAEEILKLKYLDEGQSWDDKVKNMVEALYRPWFKYSKEEVYDAIFNYNIIFGGSVTANVDNDTPTSLSNCFVIEGPEDNYEDILRADAELAHIMKRRGGVGLDLSKLRPKGSPVNNAAVTSTGVVAFMERYSNTTKEVAQGGRRGALMLTLDIRHPDALDFINAKTNTDKITGANISIKLTKEFMKCAEEGRQFIQQFPIDSTHPTIAKQVNASEILKRIAENIKTFAEPGILFWDTIMDNRIDREGYPEMVTQSTNPCGEIPLAPYDSCRLLHINMYNLVENRFKPNAYVDEDETIKICNMAVDLGNAMIMEESRKVNIILDKIEVEDSDRESIEHKLWTKILNKLAYKRLGIGKTGYADYLAALGLNYSKESVSHTINIVDIIYNHIESRSIELLEHLEEEEYEVPRVNIGLHTVAPVGSGSIIADISSGIEPLFGAIIQRRRRATESDNKNEVEIDDNGDAWVKYIHIHEPLLEFARVNGKSINVTDLDNLNRIFKDSPYYNNVASDIIPGDKLKLQQVFQEKTDHSISITHNYPKETETLTIYNAIVEAFDLNLKGFTAYVDGSRTNILEVVTASPSDRPIEISAEVHNLKAREDKFYGIVGLKDRTPSEIFIFKDSSIEIKSLKNAKIIKRIVDGGNIYDLTSDSITIKDLASKYNSGNNIILTKLLSRLLRRGESIEKILEDFKTSNGKIGSFQNAIASVLEYYTNNQCPTCKSDNLAFQEGCLTCLNCGYSKCG